MQALVETRTQHSFGANDVDRFQVGNPGKEIEVGDIQAVVVRNPVGDGHDDAPDRIGERLADQLLTQQVFVTTARFANAALVLAERGSQKPRLLTHPPDAAIDLRVCPVERTFYERFEPRHLLRLPAQLIVEAQHLGHQAGTKLERDLDAAGCSRERGSLRDDGALDRGQPAQRVG